MWGARLVWPGGVRAGKMLQPWLEPGLAAGSWSALGSLRVHGH